jgi:hypothetical protein
VDYLFHYITRLFSNRPAAWVAEPVHLSGSLLLSHMPTSLSTTDSLLADKAVSNETEDSFQRYPFARHLADTICERRSADSLVIGLYGKWGAGKSSVLNFIQAELAGTEVLTVYFNPWRFEGEEQLLLGFFAELSAALENVTTDAARQAAQQALAGYAKKVVTKLQLLDRDPTADSLKELKSQAKLEGLKQQVNELLRTLGKRVLVLIDDIDRLSSHEIHAILRLVKLTGDFHYTTYLLACDDKVVAQAISERYAGGSEKTGRRYLEKIIQVPLRLPVIQQAAMQKYFHEGFSRSLLLTNTQLSEEENQRLVSLLSASILPQVTTPRHVTRYSNTLLVILPLLRGEANMVDLMLLEALKQFYPKLYKLVSRNQSLLTGVEVNTSVRDIKVNYDPVFGPNGANMGQAHGLLNALFPKLGKVYGGFMAGSLRNATEDTLYAHQAVASAYYFRRYFSYAVQDGEIPETSFSNFLTAMTRGDVSLASTYAISMIERASDVEFLRRLEIKSEEITSANANTYCELLLTISEKFTIEATTERAMRPFSRTSSLLLSYLNLLPADTIFSVTNHLLANSANIHLAYELLRDITSLGHWSDDNPLDNFKIAVTPVVYKHFNRIIIDRILPTLGPAPWYKSFSHGALNFLSTWHRAYGQEKTTAALRDVFNKDPKELLSFLEHMSNALQTIADPRPRYLSLDIEVYNKLKDLVNIEYVRQVASGLVEGAEPIPYNDNPRHIPTMIERAHQLLHFYITDIDRLFEE